MGKQIGIGRALTIATDVRQVLSDWKQEFERWAVPAEDCERLSSGIENRLKKS